MTTEPPVVYDVQNGVATIELNRPAASNALDLGLTHALGEAVAAARADDDVRVVLLLGRGKLFCAGGDVTLMAAAGASDRGEHLQHLADAAHEVVRGIGDLGKPVVTGVQGAAAGAGLAYTLSADLVVAGESAKFLTAYTAIGLCPDSGLSWLLPQAVGLKRALELTLTNRRLTAFEALDWGIVTSICPDDAVAETARNLAARLAAGPALAYGRTRSLIRSASDHSLSDHLEVEARTLAELGSGPEAAALIDAFAGGRR